MWLSCSSAQAHPVEYAIVGAQGLDTCLALPPAVFQRSERGRPYRVTITPHIHERLSECADHLLTALNGSNGRQRRIRRLAPTRLDGAAPIESAVQGA
jgi:hypothetical protein